MSINVISTGSYTSDEIIDNKYLSRIVDTNEQWIIERTGIKTRHISRNITTEEMALEACKRAIRDTNIDINEIGLVIFATITSDTVVPSSSFTIAGKLGIEDSICFDLNAACSGFIYSISVAESLLKNSDKKYALVIGAEKLTKLVDWEDRSTCILFGDGAGCLLLSKDNNKYKDKFSIEIKDWILGGKYDSKKFLDVQ